MIFDFLTHSGITYVNKIFLEAASEGKIKSYVMPNCAKKLKVHFHLKVY